MAVFMKKEKNQTDQTRQAIPLHHREIHEQLEVHQTPVALGYQVA